ncbi:hypothetical protein [Shewanella gaetbuli]|uniref:Uncharacterized protein n=1 Tax=Shewanella gaetbuli TaxID=220752 RepID=A0A9X1ZNS7_9GAMM|nr:hypothetical protein [Shewanella gaetbuli]MCL1142855.1 hypothetical protein [Shewanella gaetbuli]
MRFNQSFNPNQFKSRFNGMNPVVALIAFVAFSFVSLVLLPFLLLFGLLSFITMQFFGRKILASKMIKSFYTAQGQAKDAYQGYGNVNREPQAPYADMFRRQNGQAQNNQAQQSQYSGRTFEHQAD